MDVQDIEQIYNQLQGQAQQTAQALQTLGNKLQTAANNGDQQAREWSLDLRELALSFRDEQNQVANLLQALHGSLANQAQQIQQQPETAPAPQQGGSFLGNLLNSGFAQSIEAGAGFGIGDDLIKKLF